jgi:hypothetical protein
MGFAPEFVLCLLLYAQLEPAYLTSTVQSICEFEDKGRDRVGIE